MLRIAVQAKGRLYEETMQLFAEAGIRLEMGKRTLLVQAKDFPVEVLFLRDDDIPQAVADGAADAGVVGENEYRERKKNVTVVKKLGFSKCRLSLAIPKDECYTGLEWFNGKVIATSYPVILQDFLLARNISAHLHVISGSVEIAPGIGLADAIFDIVSSGGTLTGNHLKEVETVMPSEALLIGHPNLSATKTDILNDLIFRINAVQTAAGKKYILLNAPNNKIADIIQLLPGMKSPSVLPLAQDGWSSLHSVIEEKHFWEIIGKLKTLGAEGILVIPIEKMIV
ncbi:MAG: ATP phosphoribosyltransferase [Bacteroidales bacterium]|nr:ATP phosphoribosyltransferase [Bacteroidales bacterium]